MPKRDIPRAQLITVMGTSPSGHVAARALGYHSGTGLRERLKIEGLTVRRVCPPGGAQSFVVIEDRRPC